jgi:hypothetical protein
VSPYIVPILGILCGLVAIIGGVFIKPWLKLKERQLEIQSREAAEKAAQYAAHTDRLEQRVRVLERIVTDKGIVVADEIESLRDRPVN